MSLISKGVNLHSIRFRRCNLECIKKKDKLYSDVIRETITMTYNRFGNENLFYSASDAESDHIEVDLLDKYTTSAFGRMIQNLLFLASLSEETKYIKIAKISLTYYGSSLLDSSNNAPSSLIAWLIEHYGVVTLSHRKEILLINKKQIDTINYP